MAQPVEEETGYTETLKGNDRLTISCYDDIRKAIRFTMPIVNDSTWDSYAGYTLEKQDKATGDKVFSFSKEPYGRIFRCEAILSCKCGLESFFQDIYYNIDACKEWNTDVSAYTKVRDLGKQIDIVYSASNPVLGGIVKGREFVDIRAWRKIRGAYCVFTVDCGDDSIPSDESKTRGKDEISFVRISTLPDDHSKIKFEWFAKIDLKGMLPTSIVDKATSYFMLNYIHSLRHHIKNDLGG